MRKRKQHLILFLIIAMISNSCTEPFDIKTITFESALVIEATITNELKYQEINLSRTFKLEDNGPSSESNANVKIIDDLQNTYNFHETDPGKYVSNNEFSALANRNYQLKIVTNKGDSYSSQLTKLTNISKIDKVYVEKSEDGTGVNIFVDSHNPNGNSRYYRYEYEETYKIIAAKWAYSDLIVVSKKPPIFDFKPRDDNKRVCYNTIFSKGIIQTETNNLIEDKVTKLPIRHISRDNYIITHRYSMLLKQNVQSQEAYVFYKTLNNLSDSGENLFSQNQPGFITGNIYSDDNPNEKVIGFFEVSSVSTKRIFFSPSDVNLLIPSEKPYPISCDLIAPELKPGSGKSLFDYLESGSLKYFQDNDGTGYPLIPPGGPYIMVPTGCADCTQFGSNIVPEFWKE